MEGFLEEGTPELSGEGSGGKGSGVACLWEKLPLVEEVPWRPEGAQGRPRGSLWLQWREGRG